MIDDRCHKKSLILSSQIAVADIVFAMSIIYGSATIAFCEYGGTQNRSGYDVKPLDMPPMDS